jgi:uncharacterized protein YqjF (DUF2071 family)
MIGDILKANEHRPYPLPEGPWVMRQRWSNLLFAHWPIPPAAMRLLVPEPLVLDTFDGQAWVGVVPFRMRHVRPRLLPALPWLSYFPELNVRTYVRVRDRGIDKSGVYFFSLDAANPIAVELARRTFHLPYFRASMNVAFDGHRVLYTSKRTHHGAPGAVLMADYRSIGPVYRAQPGHLDHWLTERYSLFTVDSQGHAHIGEIHHMPWPLQPAAAAIQANTMAGAAAMQLPVEEPLLHYAHHIDMVTWAPRRVEPA